MAEQRERSRAAGRRTGVAADADADAARAVLADHGPTVFTGREEDATDGPGAGGHRRLGRTWTARPFYAESGGQVGDTGSHHDGHGHRPGARHHLRAPRRRTATRWRCWTGTSRPARRPTRPSTPTAGRRSAATTPPPTCSTGRCGRCSGDHVKQQGSLVGPDRLRFDFSHHGGLTDEEIARIEDLANAEVLSNEPVRHFETIDGRGAGPGGHRLLRREVRRGGAGARGRPAQRRALRWHPRAPRSATSAWSRWCPRAPSGPTCGGSRP